MTTPITFLHPSTAGAISVILIAKDAQRFLAQALGSVRAQHLRPLEVLLVLGESKDGTDAVARSFPEVTCLRQPGRGIADAWNCGIAHARGELLAFLSADDRWSQDKLQLQVGRMLAEPRLAYTIAHFRYVLEPGCEWPRNLNPKLNGQALPGRIMETLVARRQLFAELGGFDPGLSTAEDVDFYLRAQERGVPMALLDDVLLHKRLHGGNASLAAAANTRNLFTTLRRSLHRREEAPPHDSDR